MCNKFLKFSAILFFLFMVSGETLWGVPKGAHGQSDKPGGVKPLQEIRKAEKARAAQKGTPEEREQKIKTRNDNKKERALKQRKAQEAGKKEIMQREKLNKGDRDATQR